MKKIKKKILRETIKELPQNPSLKVYKFNNSSSYYCSFYVGTKVMKSGNIEKSLRTKNVNDAIKKAKHIYNSWWKENNEKTIKTEKNFDKDIAQEFLRHRFNKYKGRNSTQPEREQLKYDNYLKKYFEDVDYTNIENVNNVINDIIENLKLDKKTDNTISKYISLISQMFKRGLNNGVITRLPDFPTFKVINQERPSYFNSELNMISKQLDEEYNSSKDKFYLETKDYINLIRSGGFRPGIEPLKIKRFQYRFINDKDNPTEPILLFTLFGTKTKPKHQLTCHPYFTKHIFIPEILKRNENTKSNDYLLFPTYKDRQSLYRKISSVFTRISKKLELYYRNGSTRPIYAIRHTFAKNRYNQNASLEVVARQMNTSTKMLHRNYLDNDDKMLLEEHKRLFPYWNNKEKDKSSK